MLEDKLVNTAAIIVVVFSALLLGCQEETNSNLTVIVTATPASIGINGTSIITAEVRNFQGSPIVGAGIEWGTNFASLQSGNSATGSDGRATATLRGVGTVGLATITATTLTTRDRGVTTVRIGLD